jgi:hypothetical protein
MRPVFRWFSHSEPHQPQRPCLPVCAAPVALGRTRSRPICRKHQGTAQTSRNQHTKKNKTKGINIMNNEKETKLSFNGEEEMMDYVHQCQQLDFLKSKSEIEPVEQILVDPSDENHWDDLHVLILRNNRIVVEDGGFTHHKHVFEPRPQTRRSSYQRRN